MKMVIGCFVLSGSIFVLKKGDYTFDRKWLKSVHLFDSTKFRKRAKSESFERYIYATCLHHYNFHQHLLNTYSNSL